MSVSLDLPAYLQSKGHRVYRAAGQEVTAHCWFCPDGDTKGKGKLYLNTESWLWGCKRCDTKGNRKALLAHFGDTDEDEPTFVPGTNPAMRRKALSEAADLATDMLYGNPKILAWLTDRGLSMQTVVDARLGYVPQSWSLAQSLRADNTMADLRAAGIVTEQGQDSFGGHLTIPFLSYGDVVQLRGRGMHGQDAKYITPGGDNARLYGADDLHGARQAIIVEGEFDAMILKQHLKLSTDAVLRDETAVVGLSGAGSLPIGFAGYFEECRKVYIALDPDETGEKAALRIKELLGSKSRIVELPKDLPKCDWTEFLRTKSTDHPHGGHTWRDVERMLHDADAVGRRLFTARDAQIQFQKIEDQVGGILLGFKGLDTHIQPGLKPGQLLIPLARTGVGKTQFLVNVIWNLRERPQLMISLEMTAPEVYARLRRVAHFWHPLATDADITRMLSGLRIYDQRMKPGEMTRLVEEFREETGLHPQVVHLDYLGYYAANVPGGSQYERVTKAVISIKEEAKACEVAMIAPHQANRGAADGTPVGASDARDSGAIEDTADILISLFRPSDADRDADNKSVDGTVRSGILKNRNGLKNVYASLNFSMASLVMVDKTDRLASALVDEENHMIFRGETYERVRKMRMEQSGHAAQLKLA